MTTLTQMRAHLATIKPKKVVSPAKHVEQDTQSDEMSFMEGTAVVIGALPVHVLSFKDAVRDSYKYHNDIRNAKSKQ